MSFADYAWAFNDWLSTKKGLHRNLKSDDISFILFPYIPVLFTFYHHNII